MKVPPLLSLDFQSFDKWCAWANKYLLHVEANSMHGDRFFAHIDAIQTKDVLWSQGFGTPLNMRRKAEHLSLPSDTGASQMYCLVLQHSYTPRSTIQHGREVVIGNNDLMLLDMREAFHVIDVETVSKSSGIFLNPAVVDAWLPNASDLVARRIDGRV